MLGGAALAAALFMAPATGFGLTTTWVAPAGTGPAPAGVPEFNPNATVFFQPVGVWDSAGRVLDTAQVTVNTADAGVLTKIQSTLYLNAFDADLFKIQITDPSTFQAFINGPTFILALFAEDGTAIAASRGGGVGNAITGGSLSAGQYYIGVAAPDGIPRNDANEALFDFSSDGVKTPEPLADLKLSTDPFIAWTINGGDYLLGVNTFTAGTNSHIHLTGANFSVIPEPGTAVLIAAAGSLLLLRRKRSA
jgi:hypothetical protein